MNFLRKKRWSAENPFPNAAAAKGKGVAVHTESSGWEHEVFLSFSGEDARKTLADYLYQDLVSAGVIAFRDAEGLPMGESIGSNLVEAIRCSKISIPILSPGYAYSKWCLLELVEIVNCSRARGQLVMPVFYKVDPTHVRNQTGCYEDAFRGHKDEFSDEVVEGWRYALAEVGRMKGLVVETTAGGHQGALVKLIVKQVLRDLKKGYLDLTDCLVGTGCHVEKLLSLLDMNSNDTTSIVGIYGIGGIGKTTLAKVVYNTLLDQFDSCSFLESIRDKDLRSLQEQLVSDILKQKDLKISSLGEGVGMIRDRFRNKKVLILLDDVDHRRQLENLAREPEWFGKGSKIIVTTRIKSVLCSSDVDSTYELRELNDAESLQLISRHAFRMEHPREGFLLFCKQLVSIAAGLPLALEILGSYLYGKDELFWKSKLKNIRNRHIQEVADRLKITYDGLTYEEQQIFLDIACLFNRMDVKTAFYMWETHNYDPTEAIENLKDMCLVRVGDDHMLKMHDQLRDLGRKIVYDENSEEPWMRSRVWNFEEALNTVQKRKGTNKVKALCLEVPVGPLSEFKYYPIFSDEQFAKLPFLKFLQLEPSKLEGNFHGLLNMLSWLQWRGCPAVDAPSNFLLENLVVLDLSWSKLSESWNGWSQLKGKRLKILNLTGCSNLVKTPDFSAYTTLARLILEWCGSLVEIDGSIGQLRNLEFLNFSNCRKLKKVPLELGFLGALKVLLIKGTLIQELPFSENLTMLQIVEANDCLSLPSVIGYSTYLRELVFDQSSIGELPDSIGSLVNLQRLSLRSCRYLKSLPESVEKLVSLIELILDRSNIIELPATIGRCSSLQILGLCECPRLQSMPALPVTLTDLRITWEETDLKFPNSINVAKLLFCTSSEAVQTVSLTDFSTLPTVPFSDLIRLTFFELEYLTFFNSFVTTSLVEFTAFPQLKELTVSSCDTLQSLSELPSQLSCLKVDSCGSLKKLPNLSNLSCLIKLSITRCNGLTEIQCLEELQTLRILDVSYCSQLLKLVGVTCLESLEFLDITGCWSIRLPDLSHLKKLILETNSIKHLSVHTLADWENFCDNVQHFSPVLQTLTISDVVSFLPEGISGFSQLNKLSLHECKDLKYLPGLPPSLVCLHIEYCCNIQEWPDLSNLKNLSELLLLGYHESLKEIRGLKELQSLTILNLRLCKNLRTLDGVEYLKSLRQLRLAFCDSLQSLSDLSELRNLEFLEICYCDKLKVPEIRGLTSKCKVSNLEVQSV